MSIFEESLGGHVKYSANVTYIYGLNYFQNVVIISKKQNSDRKPSTLENRNLVQLVAYT